MLCRFFLKFVQGFNLMIQDLTLQVQQLHGQRHGVTFSRGKGVALPEAELVPKTGSAVPNFCWCFGEQKLDVQKVGTVKQTHMSFLKNNSTEVETLHVVFRDLLFLDMAVVFCQNRPWHRQPTETGKESPDWTWKNDGEVATVIWKKSENPMLGLSCSFWTHFSVAHNLEHGRTDSK